MNRPMTKQEWFEYLEKTWDAAQKEARAEQQEPVAWKDKTYGNLHHQDFGDSIPLYNAPPKREWQGLTEKEHTDIAIQCGCMSADWVFYGATVERILKGKNS